MLLSLIGIKQTQTTTELKRRGFSSHCRYCTVSSLKVNENVPCCPVHRKSLDLTKCSPLKLVFRSHRTPKCHSLPKVWALMPSLRQGSAVSILASSLSMGSSPQLWATFLLFGYYTGNFNQRSSIPLWEMYNV